MDFLNGLAIGFLLGVFRKEAVYGLKALLEYIFNIKPTEKKQVDLSIKDEFSVHTNSRDWPSDKK